MKVIVYKELVIIIIITWYTINNQMTQPTHSPSKAVPNFNFLFMDNFISLETTARFYEMKSVKSKHALAHSLPTMMVNKL